MGAYITEVTKLLHDLLEFFINSAFPKNHQNCNRCGESNTPVILGLTLNGIEGPWRGGSKGGAWKREDWSKGNWNM